MTCFALDHFVGSRLPSVLRLLYPSTIHGEEEGAVQENIFTSAAKPENPGPSSDVQLHPEDDGYHNNNDNIDVSSSLESSNLLFSPFMACKYIFKCLA